MIFILLQDGAIVGHTKSKRIAIMWVCNDENTRSYAKSSELFTDDMEDSDEDFIYHK